MLHCKWWHFRKWNILKSYDFLDWPTITDKNNNNKKKKATSINTQVVVVPGDVPSNYYYYFFFFKFSNVKDFTMPLTFWTTLKYKYFVSHCNRCKTLMHQTACCYMPGNILSFGEFRIFKREILIFTHTRFFEWPTNSSISSVTENTAKTWWSWFINQTGSCYMPANVPCDDIFRKWEKKVA